MSESKAVILGCQGLELTPDERAFFQEQRPFGFILFARNLESAEQILSLTSDLRETIEQPFAPILIDQEGGRVQRLWPPLADIYPHASQLGALYHENSDLALHAAWLMSRLHAFDLLKLGINVNCLPVLDIPTADGHDIIGKRAYGDQPRLVAHMGTAAAQGLKAGGMLPVIKHMPGHGRATADTHLELPTVHAGHNELRAKDFVPFQEMSDELMAMTAHIVFSSIDPHNPATTSKIVIETIIRQEIGFNGLLMSDDVSMKALSGDFDERARQIFAAGCDIVLHCNGDFDEMRSVCNVAPLLEGQAQIRANKVLNAFIEPDDQIEQQCRDEFAALKDMMN